MKVEQSDKEGNEGAAWLAEEEFESLRTNGIKVNYLLVCLRKLWLYSKGIRMETRSDRVILGQVLHEQAYRYLPRRELPIDHLIKVDVLAGDQRILEVKYSHRLKEAARLQVSYYLYYLKRRGATEMVGELRFPREKKREELHLNPQVEREVERALLEIRRIEELPTPPEVKQMPFCASCAYAELCWG